MDAVRRRSPSPPFGKKTLYSWFGDRNGLLTALIERDADQAATGESVPHSAPPSDRPGLVALNRATMISSALAEHLLQSGRRRVGPLVQTYLAALDEADTNVASDPGASFGLLERACCQ